MIKKSIISLRTYKSNYVAIIFAYQIMSYGELYGTRTGYFVQEKYSLVSIEDAWIARAKLDGRDELLQSLERCLCISLLLSSSMKAGDAEDQNGMIFLKLEFQAHKTSNEILLKLIILRVIPIHKP